MSGSADNDTAPSSGLSEISSPSTIAIELTSPIAKSQSEPSVHQTRSSFSESSGSSFSQYIVSSTELSPLGSASTCTSSPPICKSSIRSSKPELRGLPTIMSQWRKTSSGACSLKYCSSYSFARSPSADSISSHFVPTPSSNVGSVNASSSISPHIESSFSLSSVRIPALASSPKPQSRLRSSASRDSKVCQASAVRSRKFFGKSGNASALRHCSINSCVSSSPGRAFSAASKYSSARSSRSR